MSPLACSLLALAALLAAADAKITILPQPLDGRCAAFRMDITSKPFGSYVKTLKSEFYIDGDRQLHRIIDGCVKIGAAISSQTVRVCNYFSNPKQPVWYPPRVAAVDDERLSPVVAACYPGPEADNMCGQLTVYVTQECRIPYVLGR